MKHKGTWVKILLLSMCLVFVFSSLIGCGQDEEIAALQQALDEIKEKVDTAATDLDTLEEAAETKVAVKELHDLVDEIKKTADAAATLSKLEEVIENLEAVKKTADSAATAQALEDAIDALSTRVDGLEEELKGKITDLERKYTELSGKVDANGADIETVKTDIKNIQTALDELKANDFAKKYQDATEALLEGEYSLESFNALVATVNEADYADADYARFMAKVEDLTFFLNRALSVEQIKGYFDELKELIDEMPTLVESLTTMIEEIETNKTLTTDPNCLDQLKAIHSKITEEIDAGLQTRYETVVAAHDNLLAAVTASEDQLDAQEVIDAISGIEAPIVYLDSEEAVATVEALFNDYKAQYFANENYTKLYSEGISAETLVTNYQTLVGYRARLSELSTAAASKIAVSEKALNFEITRPLWSDLDALEANKTDIDTNWYAKYHIDEENLAKIYGDEYELLVDAIAYAAAMNTVYTDNGVAELITNMQALCDKETVLYTDLALVQGENSYRAKLDALKASIEKVEEWEEDVDANFTTMIGADLLEQFAAVEARMAELVKAKAEIDAIVEKMTAMKGKVTFADYDTIDVTFGDGIENVCAEYEIAKGDANYTAFVESAVSLHGELLEEYKALTARVAEIYQLVEEKINGTKWKLSDGNMVIEITNYLADLPNVWGVSDINLNLTLILDDGTEQDANLSDLMTNWYKVAGKYNTLAESAQEEAVPVTEAIKKLENELNANDVKDNAAIADIWALFAEWAAEYLGMNDVSNDEAVRAAIAAIQEIEVLDGNGAHYVFVSDESFETLNTAYDTSVSQLKAAKEAWATLKPQMEALSVEGWNIHSDFASVENAYNEYVADYYANVIAEDTQLEGEWTLYQDFTSQKNSYTEKLNNAKNDAQAIKDAIAGLVTPTKENAQSMIDATAEIRELVNTYYTDYGCAILECEMCGITAGEALTLEKVEAQATYTKAYADFINALEDETVVTKAEVEAALSSANVFMAKAETSIAVNAAKGIAESSLEDFKTQLDNANA